MVQYRNLFWMVVISFVAMYALMYMMVNEYANVYSNLNQFYMAGLMTIPMLIIELVLMRSMYMNQRLNVLIVGFSLLTLAGLVILIRQQVAISDREFLKSMIPHHASALLMCQRAALQDPGVKQLCKSIMASQQKEIDYMRAKLETIKR